MQSLFGSVLWIVCAVGVVIAIVCLLAGRRAWEEFGRSGMVMERDSVRRPAAGSGAALHERDDEIRQMLEARNRRRARRGEEPLDVEGELARLTAPQIDAELRDEIRSLVIARNHRRVRRGEAPLDVEAEVEREISGLSGI